MEREYATRTLRNMAITKSRLNIVEEDGSPSTFPYKLKVTNGTLTDNGDGTTSLSAGSGSGASTALDNLASVAINTSLISDTDSTDDLGSSSKYWANAYVDKIYLNGTAFFSGANAGMIGVNTNNPLSNFDIVGTFRFRDAETPTKSFRYRFGGAMDVEGAGTDLYWSVWQNADFSGPQYNKAVMESGSNTFQLIANIQFRDTPHGSIVHIIDAQGGGDVVFNDPGDPDRDFRIEGDTDANLIFVDASADRVGIGESVPDYKLDVNGAIGFTPGNSVTPVDNGDVVIEATNNTTLTLKLKGSDGTVRSTTLTLS